MCFRLNRNACFFFVNNTRPIKYLGEDSPVRDNYSVKQFMGNVLIVVLHVILPVNVGKSDFGIYVFVICAAKNVIGVV